MRCPLLPILVLASALASAQAAGTATVTTVDDVVDFPQPQTLAQLPGPDGRVSLREAILAANNTPGPDTISFAIPTSDWWLVNDMAVLRLEGQGFALLDNGTTLDFESQTLFTGDTNPAGPEVGIYGLTPNYLGQPAIFIGADGCLVRGLGHVWNRASVAIVFGTGNRIEACVTPVIQLGDTSAPGAVGNVIGGTAPGSGNRLQAVELTCYANDNLILGNELETVHLDGSPFCALPSGNRIGGPSAAERNVIAGFGEYSDEGFPLGQGVNVVRAHDTRVEGNYIGTTPDGLAVVPGIGPTGIHVAESTDTVLVGNLIAGMRTVGINHFSGQIFGQAIHVNAISADTGRVTIQGNRLGLDAAGTGALPNYRGVLVRSSSNNRHALEVLVGGLQPGQGNHIAHSELQGIAVQHPNHAVEISGNRLEASGALGIDLGSLTQLDGVTPNDPGDLDQAGGNLYQNYPLLRLAQAVGGELAVAGRLDSAPARPYRLEFFASPTAHATGHGEASRFLGSHPVTADAAGRAPFFVRLERAVPRGWVVSATATDLVERATSEFSAGLRVGPSPTAPQ